MKKKNRIVYWIATLWLALGMTSTAIVQIIHMDKEVDNFNQLHYPLYLMTIIGTWKLLGVIAILVPKFPILKEWAYAGFFFAMTGAIISHIISKDAIGELFGPSLLLVLTILSWHFRPADRRIILATP